MENNINLVDRLQRYSKQCITERLDADFADAVEEAVKCIINAKRIMGLISKVGYEDVLY